MFATGHMDHLFDVDEQCLRHPGLIYQADNPRRLVVLQSFSLVRPVNEKKSWVCWTCFVVQATALLGLIGHLIIPTLKLTEKLYFSPECLMWSK